jgi:hypothetical protein
MENAEIFLWTPRGGGNKKWSELSEMERTLAPHYDVDEDVNDNGDDVDDNDDDNDDVDDEVDNNDDVMTSTMVVCGGGI